MWRRAKEIKHSGPNIGRKVVKKASTVVNHSAKTSPSPSPLPARPRGRPPKNSYPQKPSVDVVDSVKRKNDDGALSASATDKFPLR